MPLLCCSAQAHESPAASACPAESRHDSSFTGTLTPLKRHLESCCSLPHAHDGIMKTLLAFLRIHPDCAGRKVHGICFVCYKMPYWRDKINLQHYNWACDSATASFSALENTEVIIVAF